jgi:hypothetical protein
MPAEEHKKEKMVDQAECLKQTGKNRIGARATTGAKIPQAG